MLVFIQMGFVVVSCGRFGRSHWGVPFNLGFRFTVGRTQDYLIFRILLFMSLKYNSKF